MEELLVGRTETETWKTLIQEASTLCHQSLAVDLESYLVFLLMRFIKRPELVSSVLALEYLHAHEIETRRSAALQQVGDKCLIFAGLFEMFGVAMINKLHKDRNWKSLDLLILGFGASFICLSYAMETIPMGTAYAIWTGIGASGGAILGMLLYSEAKDWKRLVFIAMVLSAAVGLKLVY